MLDSYKHHAEVLC